MAGGVIAAPFAAWLVSRVSPALLGTAVGGVIVLTNSQKLIQYLRHSLAMVDGDLHTGRRAGVGGTGGVRLADLAGTGNSRPMVEAEGEPPLWDDPPTNGDGSAGHPDWGVRQALL